MIDVSCPYISATKVIAGIDSEWACLSHSRNVLYARREKQETPKCICKDYSRCRWQRIDNKIDQQVRELELAVIG
jgi:hypothetical protein